MYFKRILIATLISIFILEIHTIHSNAETNVKNHDTQIEITIGINDILVDKEKPKLIDSGGGHKNFKGVLPQTGEVIQQLMYSVIGFSIVLFILVILLFKNIYREVMGGFTYD